MKKTKNEFRRRCLEVNKYIDVMSLLDKGNCDILCVSILGEELKKTIDTDLARILKANAFLLLYNLMEATIRNSITAIVDSINSENLAFSQISDKIKELWIKQEVKDIKDINQNYKIVSNISQKILKSSLLELKDNCIKISGNIDAMTIRNIAKQFGYEESKDGRSLLLIKEKRNKLAHGEYSFAEVGKEYTVSEISNLNLETQNYIKDVLISVEEYITKKKYKES